MTKYINMSRYEFDINRFNPITNCNGFIKPNGGLWACTYEENYVWRDTLDILGISYRMKNYKYYNIFELREDARILNISCIKDLEDVMEKYQSEETKKIGLSILSQALDFEKLAKDYDAFHVEDCEVLYINYFYRSYSLYGYDCESLIVFNPDIMINIESIKIGGNYEKECNW